MMYGKEQRILSTSNFCPVNQLHCCGVGKIPQAVFGSLYLFTSLSMKNTMPVYCSQSGYSTVLVTLLC